MNIGIDPNIKIDESTKSVEDATTSKVESNYLHDKRYEKPFEDEGAYADDDID